MQYDRGVGGGGVEMLVKRGGGVCDERNARGIGTRKGMVVSGR